MPPFDAPANRWEAKVHLRVGDTFAGACGVGTPDLPTSFAVSHDEPSVNCQGCRNVINGTAEITPPSDFVPIPW